MPIVQIEVNTRCNFKCWFCQNSQYEAPANEYMSLGEFEKILFQIKSYYRKKLPLISFAAYNEPTLDPLFKERLRLMTKLGFTYWWLSNGSLMSDELVDFILFEKPNISNFYLNLCSIDPQVLASSVGITPVAAQRYISNLEKALSRLNKSEHQVIIKVHGDSSVDHQQQFELMKDWARPFGVKVIKVGVMDRAGMLVQVGKKFEHKNSRSLICSSNYLNNQYIGVKGNLYLCCHDYFQKTSYGRMQDSDIVSLLSNKQRKKSLMVLKEQFCKHCEFAIDYRSHPLKAAKHIYKRYRYVLPKFVHLGFRSLYRSTNLVVNLINRSQS